MARRSIAGMMFLGLCISLAGSARADTDLELLGGRFRVTAEWRTLDDATGTGQALPLADETGLFWFFTPGNAELVVKVLDACTPPFNRFWVYAAGLTNVQVELTVEDTWTGRTKTYLRPAGALFAPIADTTTFNGCGITQSPCGSGTSADIAATPRPNSEAEVLALLLGSGVTADPATYARLDDDLKRIRALHPDLADVGFALVWDPSSLIVELTPTAYDSLKAGKYDEWACLNGWYRGEVDHVYTFSHQAVLRFEGFFHPVRIGADYEALPGVVKASSNGIGYPSGEPVNDLCVAVDGAAYDYFFEDQTGGGHVWYIRVPQPGAAPVVIGQVGSQQPQPDWWHLFEQCQKDFNGAAQH